MSVTINGTDGLVFADASTQNTAATGFGFKNRILNGNMAIDQRNAGASVANPSGYTLDRWNVNNYTDAVVAIVQDTSAPAGFRNSLKATVNTADTSIGASQNYFVSQAIEGYNISDMGFGASGASTFTVSFWVKSSVTGTFGGSFQNADLTRSYPFTYVISAANTWEQKTLTVTGDTAGTWNTTNGAGLQIRFSLAAGSSLVGTAGAWAGADYRGATGQTQFVSTLSATWQVTGVQLEKGSTATSFDYRPYGTELQLCQRYFEQWDSLTSADGAGGYGFFGVNMQIGSGDARSVLQYQVKKRSAPTVSYSGTFRTQSGPWTDGDTTSTLSFDAVSVNTCRVYITGTSGGTSGYCGMSQYMSSGSYISFSSEL